MSDFVTLQPQPDFPREDLTDSNAGMLELMLANAMIVYRGHQSAEKVSYVFSVGHRAIMAGNSRVFDGEHNKISAINLGVSSYETIAALVGDEGQGDFFTVNTNGAALATVHGDYQLIKYQQEAYERFLSETPRAAEVVSKSAGRYHGHLAYYAVYGAAIAYRFELDAEE